MRKEKTSSGVIADTEDMLYYFYRLRNTFRPVALIGVMVHYWGRG